jgi:hypothetical protein
MKSDDNSESSAEAVLQKNSLWQVTPGRDTGKSSTKAQDLSDQLLNSLNDGSRVELRIDGLGKISAEVMDKPSKAEREKLVNNLDKALQDQVNYGQADFLIPAVIAGAVFATRYNKPLAIGLGAAAAVGIKIYNSEHIDAAKQEANNAIAKMPLRDSQHFASFKTDMSNSTDLSSNAYLPFAAYTLMSFIPVANKLYSPTMSIALGAAAIGIDTYQSFGTRPQTLSRFQAAQEVWKKERGL